VALEVSKENIKVFSVEAFASALEIKCVLGLGVGGKERHARDEAQFFFWSPRVRHLAGDGTEPQAWLG
jgi:hypothetical protein